MDTILEVIKWIILLPFRILEAIFDVLSEIADIGLGLLGALISIIPISIIIILIKFA